MATCSVNGLQDLLGKVGLDTPVPAFAGGDIIHNPQDIFRAYLADTLQKLVDCDRAVAYDAIQPSNVTGMGDLVIVSPRLRLKDIKPKDLVSDLAHRLPRSPPFACPIADGIHLRVLSSPNTLSRLLLPYIHDRNESYGYDASLGLVDAAASEGARKKVVVEFSSPNMASEFNVSHLRSTLIGAYVANIHARMGWDVVKMNYLGDWGKQIGLLAAGWQRFGSEDEFQKQPLRHLLGVNHKIEELFKPEQDEVKAAKANNKDASEIESKGLYAERDDFFKKMEDRDPEAIALWQRFRDATVEDYTASYARLGIQFDEYSGESQVSAESIAEVETALKEKGVYEESDGSWMIDFSKHDAKGLSTAVVRYRNGTTSYLLRDLAAVLDRHKAHAFDKMIYIVKMEQEMHFHRVTKTLELMDRGDLAVKIQHVAFAKITGLLDQFKDAQLLSDYLDGCHAAMKANMPEEGEEQVFVSNTDASVESLGLSGLFIQDLNHKRTTGYACDSKKMTSFEGENGIAIQNCYARLVKTLEAKPADLDYATLDYSPLESEDYTELLRIMAQYPDTTHQSFKNLEPGTIIGYLFRLVDQLMVTLDDDDEQDWTDKEADVKARMGLYENAKQVLDNGLQVLGVKPLSS
ncbi:Fc.00g023510.m01.CDS01 [Cosmosporella sp. VM-42]